MSIELIQQLFKTLFQNEFKTRKILSTFIDETWGREVCTFYVCDTWDFHHRGKDYYDAKCRRLQSLSRTLVLTQDNTGKIQLFQLWTDTETKQHNCIEINNTSLLTTDFYEYHKYHNTQRAVA